MATYVKENFEFPL